MMRTLILLPCALAACGDLSQEDLLFRSAIPAKEDIEVVPAGAESQAQVTNGTRAQALEEECAPVDVRCTAKNVSTGLNAITFFLLDLVDTVVQHPPTTRERGRRVWGPFFDAANGHSARFEMRRQADGRAYELCLHTVEGRIGEGSADDMTCETDADEDSGLTVVLKGTLSPGALDGARARSGAGTMVFETGRLGGGLAAIGRTMSIDFDNGDERIDIQVTVTGQREEGGVADREPLTYTFARAADGGGEFGFAVFANFNQPDENLPRSERLDMVALWRADQAGRGLARVTGGDLSPNQVLIDQCWDADGTQVYARADATTQPEPILLEGDDGQCILERDAVSELLPDI
jgi:hypothetical protein